MSGFRHTIALLAILAVLAVSTAAVLPAHGHDSDNARPCDICHSSHLPCLQPSTQVHFTIQMPIVWQHASTDLGRRIEAASAVRSPRAPPV